ncbi:MobF family relaxase [Pseudonocardia humida]|uniref:Relaxase domain-containing protein n=1 Tax=Pseudonocardia humida TaxID=2800819 RepID=A0ABT1A7F9_9PSEU|nr:MobF family relaxase [Pseudonocardia humida]MCO1658901.1 relaxase domain-containing protein [Pseudonocardia humida]
MVLRISSGYSPDYLLREVATGRENYYTKAVAEGEPPGRWWGAGAESLGLTGLVDAQDMRAVYERFLDPRDPNFRTPSKWAEVSTLGHTGRQYLSEDEVYAQLLSKEPDAPAERRTELRTQAGREARRNVAFFDVTFNVQKSVTLLHTAFEAQEVAARHHGQHETAAAWGEFRQAVEDSIWAGNNAALAYLAERAGYSRIGHHGGAAGRFIDAHDWTVASFFQHDSRDHDPHLHIHNAVLNRVEGADGKFRTLDSRALYKWRSAAAAVAERVTAERLTDALGVQLAMRPDGKAREVVGIDPAAMALISNRRRTLTAKAAELVAAFETRYGRAPTSLERERLTQQATLLTRARKSSTGKSRDEVLDRVDATVRREVDGGLAGVAHTVLAGRGAAARAGQAWEPTAVIETALADVQAKRSAWTRADLTAALNDALPDHLGLTAGAQVAEFLERLTDEALRLAVPVDAARPGDDQLPGELRLANGESAYRAPGAQLYVTPDQLRTERALVAATAHGDAAALPRHVADRFVEELAESGIELGVDQAAAVRGVLTSGAQIESLVGPAGTGKSFVVGALARAWSSPELTGGTPRRVFGLATSQIATDVLTGEGLTARNVARWLATQDRLSAGAGSGGPQPVDTDAAWRLRAGDLVVVDESAMTETAALAAIHRHVEAADAKLLLVGDHRQLAAVGAGGAMDLAAAEGTRYELAEARRFTAPWERDASLRLRSGDASVLGVYHQQGRLVDASTREQAEQSAAQAWLGDTLAGRRSILLVDTNEQAAHLSAQLRAELVRLGRVEEHGVPLGLQGTYAGVGDLVQARLNGWDLAGYEGNRRGPVNRETYRVVAVRDDGGLQVAPVRGLADASDEELMALPGHYVVEHLALGYASTVHAAQGLTVDTSHSVVTAGTSPAALYVGMSRGRAANVAHVATTAEVDDAAQGGHQHSQHRNPRAVCEAVLDTADLAENRSALATAAESATEAGSVRTAAELLADASQLAATARTVGWLDRLTAEGALTLRERSKLAAEDGAATLTRVLRRVELAGRDAYAVLASAVGQRPLDDAHSPTNVLYTRIKDQGRFDPVGESWADWTPRVDDPEWQNYLDALARAADERAAQLGEEIAAEAPEWAVEAFGPPPTDADAREEWEADAGRVAAYRELRGVEDPTEALGRAPAAGQIEAYAAFRAAWRAVGRPEADRDELELTDGQLRVRMRAAAREAACAPRYVANELAGTRQAADTHRQRAALRTAEAAATADAAEQTRLHQEAADAVAVAAMLDAQAEQLQQVDDARGEWLATTATTRVNGERAAAELAARHVDEDPEPAVTAQEWLDAHRADQTVEDRHRPIVDEVEFTDHDTHTRTEPTTIEQMDADAVGYVDAARPDLRDVAASRPAPVNEDAVRVPSSDETDANVAWAKRVLDEVNSRAAEDARMEEAERNAQLARWHAADDVDGQERDAADGAGDAAVLDRADAG